jgi:hypothetical protein
VEGEQKVKEDFEPAFPYSAPVPTLPCHDGNIYMKSRREKANWFSAATTFHTKMKKNWKILGNMH